jgi:ribosomal-protein-alanine N-acetyltransferase
MASGPPKSPIPKLADLPLVVETPRLVLRPIELGDVDALYAFAADPELTKMLSWDPHTDRSETVKFVEESRCGLTEGTNLVWTIVLEDQPVGVISIDGIRWQFRAWRMDKGEIGYWLGRPHWGRGIMSEAATAALRFAFETLGLHKVTIGCVEDNHASRAIIDKVGFRFLAVEQEHFFRFGKWWDHRRYELTASEWGDSTRTLRFSRPRPPS